MEQSPLTPLSSYLKCMAVIQRTYIFMQFPTELNIQHDRNKSTAKPVRAFQVGDLYTSIFQLTLTTQVNQQSSYAKKYLS